MWPFKKKAEKPEPSTTHESIVGHPVEAIVSPPPGPPPVGEVRARQRIARIDDNIRELRERLNVEPSDAVDAKIMRLQAERRLLNDRLIVKGEAAIPEP